MPELPPEHVALIALGANLGDPARTIRAAFERLEQISIAPIRRSSLWESQPIECPPGSPPFINAAAVIFPNVSQSPESLLRTLGGIEWDLGRRPKQVLNEARPLDLDLIAFSREVRRAPELTLPHPRAHLRRFVLAPLCEIAPDFVLPGQPLTIAQLLNALPNAGDVKRLA
jgi:2-amino-4-hydroxy-6-hydroxymethyldihydropteridine diphosphokinase